MRFAVSIWVILGTSLWWPIISYRPINFISSAGSISLCRPYKMHFASAAVGPPISINKDFLGLRKVHSEPDVYVIENFLDKSSCADMIEQAKEKKLGQSPVVYAGWTTDINELLEFAAKGPVSWLAIGSAWLQNKDSETASIIEFLRSGVLSYLFFYAIAFGGIAAFIKFRELELQSMRTSTSTTLDDLNDSNSGTLKFVQRAAELFDTTFDQSNNRKEASLFEAPTIIRYEAEQVLKPHFDANRDAQTEDINRGGQTLATLIVYLNDVANGGRTRFGKLPATSPTADEQHLTVSPKLGDALLFFPADQEGRFDERLEHEGCPAVDEKWIARIWRHTNKVPPPFGLTTSALDKLGAKPN